MGFLYMNTGWCIFLCQLTEVMVLPQRGQSEPRLEAQVVPQLEQVLQPDTGVVLPQV